MKNQVTSVEVVPAKGRPVSVGSGHLVRLSVDERKRLIACGALTPANPICAHHSCAHFAAPGKKLCEKHRTLARIRFSRWWHSRKIHA